METRLLVLRDYINTGMISSSDAALIRETARVIRAGGLAAFPTETVYGLGGNALLEDSARRIYAAKGRPSDNPLIVHISDIGMLDDLASEVSREARLLSESFWPGPMTLVFKKKAAVPDAVTGGLGTVAVRLPSHPVAAMLINEADVPIAAPSANRSGRPSTTCAAHCVEDLDGRADIILDGGGCDIGLESTIIDVTPEKPVLLRPGAVTREMIDKVLGYSVSEDAALKGPLAEGVKPKAPGMKYRHYAPEAPLVLVCARAGGDTGGIARGIKNLVDESMGRYTHISILCTSECLGELYACGLSPYLRDGGSRKESGVYNPKDCAVPGPAVSEGLLVPGRDYPDPFCSPESPGGTYTDVFLTGSRSDPESIARSIFSRLREFDHGDTELIIAEGYQESELGFALMNRLKKAAAWHIVYV